MDLFTEWRSGGSELRWRSTTPSNRGAEVTVFARRAGTPGAPALVCVHGFPTSSFDFAQLTRQLGGEFDIHLLDFPGYGLSDKPPAPYEYSLYDDARLLVHAITERWGLRDYTMLTHDRGDSVGMVALELLTAEHPGSLPAQLVITNGNVYLPLSNLTAFQRALLDDTTARATASAVTPEMLAAGLGQSAFMPRRAPDDPEIIALAQLFAHHDGVAVLPDTIRYLHERAAGETGWLESLARSGVDTTLVWGLHDTIAPLRVASHVWHGYLRDKPGRNRFWVLPGADHYPQCDAPAQLADLIRLTRDDVELTFQTLGDRPDGAVLVEYT